MSGDGLVERLQARNVNRGLGIVRDTLIDEAATALTTAEARIQELEAALQASADEFDGTISGAERARDTARRTLRGE